MAQSLKRVLIMAGGTGGHVFPGLALANYCQQRGIDVHWLGTPKSFEAQHVPKANIPLHMINITGIRRNGFLSAFNAPFKVSAATYASLKLIKQIQPDVVVGMGGFVSGPGGLATWLARKPLVIHEQNAIAGFTNKVLSRLASRVLEAFPKSFPNTKAALTVGNPVRTDIESMPPPQRRFKFDNSPLNLLILGGSQGAQALNEIVPQAIAHLPAGLRPKILHQAGQKQFDLTQNAYHKAEVQAEIVPFIEHMDQAYAWAHMVLCRAGALTVSELCVAGLGAIFVPYPYAVDDHQTANARYLVNNGAALCIQQADITAFGLAELIKKFASDRQQCLTMAQAAYELRKPQVAQRIYEICQEICL